MTAPIMPSSPWWPLAFGEYLARNRPGNYPIPFQEWIRWRFAFGRAGGFQQAPNALEIVQAELNRHVLRAVA